MMTPEEMRRERLRNDHSEVRRLHGDVLSIQAEGSPPHRYRMMLRVKSIIGPGPTYRSEHEVQIDLGAGYPDSQPQVTMVSKPPPFHPNWFVDGRWCSGDWDMEEGLAAFVIRMIRTLRFEPGFTYPGSAANREASDWYVRNRENGLFPCDRTPLPISTGVIIEGGSRLVLEPRRVVLLSDAETEESP